MDLYVLYEGAACMREKRNTEFWWANLK